MFGPPATPAGPVVHQYQGFRGIKGTVVQRLSYVKTEGGGLEGEGSVLRYLFGLGLAWNDADDMFYTFDVTNVLKGYSLENVGKIVELNGDKKTRYFVCPDGSIRGVYNNTVDPVDDRELTQDDIKDCYRFQVAPTRGNALAVRSYEVDRRINAGDPGILDVPDRRRITMYRTTVTKTRPTNPASYQAKAVHTRVAGVAASFVDSTSGSIMANAGIFTAGILNAGISSTVSAARGAAASVWKRLAPAAASTAAAEPATTAPAAPAAAEPATAYPLRR